MPYQHIVHLVLHVLLLVASIALADAVDHGLWWISMAGLCGAAMVQIGFAGHDVEHGQVFRNPDQKRCLSLICWNLLLGLSARWWEEKHRAHHRDTHVIGADPDLYALYAFDTQQAKQAAGIHRLFIRNQHWLFWISLAFVRLYFQWLSLIFLIVRPGPGRCVELCLLVLHHAVFWFAVCSILPQNALLFVVISYAAAGVYMGIVFCTNHLGMPYAPAPQHGKRWQIAHTRNIRTGRIGAYLCGGLNYQIEHHLHPSMSRFRLRSVATSTRQLCHDLNMPYHEQNLFAALRDVHAAFRRVSTEARQ